MSSIPNGQSGPSSPTRPGTISLPSPPPLDAAVQAPFDTNTLALLLPHAALFAPEALRLLREAFEGYGTLAHWAPVRALGRVIIVYRDDEAAELAKKEGDGLSLHVDLEEQAVPVPQEGERRSYFSQPRRGASNGIVLRVYALPRTPLDVGTVHLRPPEAERNFLISPPGSPPEGWEPIVEDGPNTAPLADDLRRALEALQLSSRRRGTGPELILDEGGVRVEVEDADTKPEAEETHVDREWGEEEVQGAGPGIWRVPSQESTTPRYDINGVVRGQALGGPASPLTPSGRIMPTARPPMPGE